MEYTSYLYLVKTTFRITAAVPPQGKFSFHAKGTNWNKYYLTKSYIAIMK